jgi:hypothetical protein
MLTLQFSLLYLQDGATPLHWAVQVGALKLQIKYTVDFADDVSWKATPLIAAQQLCSKDIGDKIQYFFLLSYNLKSNAMLSIH